MSTKAIYTGIILLCFWSHNTFVAARRSQFSEYRDVDLNAILPCDINCTQTMEIQVDPPNNCYKEISKNIPSFCTLKELKLVRIYSIVTKKDDWPRWNRQELKSDSLHLTNEGDSRIEAQTPSLEFKKAAGEVLTVSNTIGLSGELQLPFPQVTSFIPSLWLANQETTTDSERMEEKMTYHAQKVNLGPRSQVNVQWILYRNDTMQKYLMSFIAKPVFQIHSDPNVSEEFLHHRRGTNVCMDLLRTKDLQYVDFFPETKELVCKNFEILRHKYHDELKVVFGEQKPL